MKFTAAVINQKLKSGEFIRDKNGQICVNPCLSDKKTASKVSKSGKKGDRALNRPKSSGHLFIENLLIESGTEFEQEFKFSPDRKFRADFHLIGKKILIEYEGVISKKSRHTTIKGYSGDCNKYNLALSLGYKVYRFTALNLQEVRELIHQINGKDQNQEAENGQE